MVSYHWRNRNARGKKTIRRAQIKREEEKEQPEEPKTIVG
jgi:hypothetical protein